MSIEDVNNIYVKDHFWVRFLPQMINFGFPGLPKRVHYTISFSDKSPDINFHITKEVEESKPKITIVCMDKQLLKEWVEGIMPELLSSFLNKILQPLDIVKFKNRYDDNLCFISFENLKTSNEYLLTEQKLIDSFKEISKFKNKTRLEVKGNIKERLDNFVSSDELNDLVFKNSINDIANDFKRNVDGGIIISEKEVICVIRITNQWFLINQNFKEADLINEFIPLSIIRQINWKTKRALVVMKKAKSFEDTKHLNNPIRLIIKTATGEIKDKSTN